MPKLQLNATELVQPDVDIVAMVKRGANRIPFRLTKKDNTDMLDLTKIGATLFAKTAAAPAVVGVVLAKGADAPAITAALKEAGLDVEDGFTKAEATAATTFTKTDAEADPDTLLVLKLDDNVALTISGPDELIKRVSGYDWESTSFSEVMTKGTFAPSLMMAQDMLTNTFFNIMEKADDPAELSTMIKTATDEFTSYVATLVTALPESVFKAEMELVKMAKDKKDKAPGDDMDADGKKKEAKKEDIADAPVHGNETPAAPGQKSNPAGTTDNDIDGNPAVGNATPTNPPEKTNGPVGTPSNDVEGNPAADSATTSTPAVKEDGADPVLAALAKMQETMTAGLADVRSHVDQSVAAVKAEVSGLGQKVAKAEAALEGTVIGDEAGDQTGGMRKSDTASSAPPLLDTAYMKLEETPKAA